MKFGISNRVTSNLPDALLISIWIYFGNSCVSNIASFNILQNEGHFNYGFNLFPGYCYKATNLGGKTFKATAKRIKSQQKT